MGLNWSFRGNRYKMCVGGEEISAIKAHFNFPIKLMGHTTAIRSKDFPRLIS